jgi:CO/xanthine dehydrogenase Mo-binding subunit
MEIAPGSVAVLLAAVAAGRPLEISNGRQTLLLRGRMSQDTLASHQTCVTSLG